MGRENWADPISDNMKAKVATLLKEGKTNAQIRRALSYRVSNSAIGAIRAHAGKYDSYDRASTPMSAEIKEEMKRMAIIEKKTSAEVFQHYKGRYKRVQIAGIFGALKKKGDL